MAVVSEESEARQQAEQAMAAREAQKQRLLGFGNALGLSPDFLRDVAARGQRAVIDRAEMVDATGAHARILSMTQRLGMLMQETAEAGQRLGPGAIMQAAELIGREHGVPKEAAIRLLGIVLDVFQGTLQGLSVGQEGEENAERPGTTTEG